MGTIVVSPEDTREDLSITLGLVNADAKQHSRRGYAGTQTLEYERLHRISNELLVDWQAAKA